MDPSMAPAERAAICVLADGLALKHGSDTLGHALYERLDAEGRPFFAESMRHLRRNKGFIARGLQPDILCACSRARMLVGHLHMMGRGELAEAIRALLHSPEFVAEASVTTTISQKWLDILDVHTSPVVDQEMLGRTLARQLRSDAPWYESNPGWMDPVAVADQIEGLLGLTSPPLVLEEDSSPDWELRAARLTADYSADVLGRALLRRLHAEGHHQLADMMREGWLTRLVGPRANAGKLVATLLAGLRERGRGDLAEGVTALLRGIELPPPASSHPSLPATLTPEVLSWLGVYAAVDLHPRAVHADLGLWLAHHGHKALTVELYVLLKPVVSPTLEDLRRSKDPYFDKYREHLEKMEADKKLPPAT